MRVPLLQKELNYTNDLLNGHKESWATHGCSIMSDVWTDRRRRSIINFMVNCSLGTMFMKSIDASFIKSGDKIYDLLDNFVKEIREQNVVQIIIDNGSNYVLAGNIHLLNFLIILSSIKCVKLLSLIIFSILCFR